MIDDTMKELGSIMQTAATVGMVDKMLSAYDGFATAAMKVLLAEIARDQSWRNAVLSDPSGVADAAWKIADAMMIERRNRGLGAPKET